MKIRVEHAKTVDITTIINKLNIQPTKENQKEAFYLSPLRQEKTASFHVDKVKNRWYDFGAGTGGDSIDFVKEYLTYTGEDNTLFDAIRFIENMSGGVQAIVRVADPELPQVEVQPKLILKSVDPISDIRLIRYLEDRKISLPVAKAHLKQVSAENIETGKTIIALGLLNENDGYEISNRRFKSSIKSKDISVIRGTDPDSGIVHVYEGKMDFLSTLTRLKTKMIKNDSIVLNSVSMLERGKDHIQAFSYKYKIVYSWFDNDEAGQTAKKSTYEFLKTMPGIVHKPMNFLYKGHKDVNEWHLANPVPGL